MKGMQMIHHIVENTDHLYVLWSDTYLSRLWCTLELATFCSLRGAECVVLLPLWFGPFTA